MEELDNNNNKREEKGMRIKITALGIQGWIVPLYHSYLSIEKREKKKGKFPMSKSLCETILSQTSCF